MLKAVIIDANASSRDLLHAVLSEGGHDVLGQTHSSAQGFALIQKHRPHFVCVALDQVEDGSDIVESIRAQMPKVLVFMVSAEIDAPTLRRAQQRGVQGFIVKPFKADTVLKIVRDAVLALVRQAQA